MPLLWFYADVRCKFFASFEATILRGRGSFGTGAATV